MDLRESGFGGHRVIIPVAGAAAPTNSRDKLSGMTMEAGVFSDGSGRTWRLSDSSAKRSLTYFADRTVYRAAFNGTPTFRSRCTQSIEGLRRSFGDESFAPQTRFRFPSPIASTALMKR